MLIFYIINEVLWIHVLQKEKKSTLERLLNCFRDENLFIDSYNNVLILFNWNRHILSWHSFLKASCAINPFYTPFTLIFYIVNITLFKNTVSWPYHLEITLKYFYSFGDDSKYFLIFIWYLHQFFWSYCTFGSQLHTP